MYKLDIFADDVTELTKERSALNRGPIRPLTRDIYCKRAIQQFSSLDEYDLLSLREGVIWGGCSEYLRKKGELGDIDPTFDELVKRMIESNNYVLTPRYDDDTDPMFINRMMQMIETLNERKQRDKETEDVVKHVSVVPSTQGTYCDNAMQRFSSLDNLDSLSLSEEVVWKVCSVWKTNGWNIDDYYDVVRFPSSERYDYSIEVNSPKLE